MSIFLRAINRFFDTYRDEGLLMMRIALGLMILSHGVPSLMAGPEYWASLGSAMEFVDVYSHPLAWGLAAVTAEVAGGVCIILGFLFRPALLFLCGTMLVAATMHLRREEGLSVASHAIELGIVFFGLMFAGPGSHAIDPED